MPVLRRTPQIAVVGLLIVLVHHLARLVDEVRA
jgi:hypothetical protein